jgi:hypothetical protein
MIHRNLLIASAILAAVVINACSDTTGPKQIEPGDVSLARGGTLRVTKECSEYTGVAGSFCTITSSNLKQIEVGSRVVYAEAAGATSLDSDVVLDPPGPGNNIAFGHCALEFATRVGQCMFSGGTGKFKKFHASVAVSPLGGPNWGWEGTYSFRPRR